MCCSKWQVTKKLRKMVVDLSQQKRCLTRLLHRGYRAIIFSSRSECLTTNTTSNWHLFWEASQVNQEEVRQAFLLRFTALSNTQKHTFLIIKLSREMSGFKSSIMVKTTVFQSLKHFSSL